MPEFSSCPQKQIYRKAFFLSLGLAFTADGRKSFIQNLQAFVLESLICLFVGGFVLVVLTFGSLLFVRIKHGVCLFQWSMIKKLHPKYHICLKFLSLLFLKLISWYDKRNQQKNSFQISSLYAFMRYNSRYKHSLILSHEPIQFLLLKKHKKGQDGCTCVKPMAELRTHLEGTSKFLQDAVKG